MIVNNRSAAACSLLLSTPKTKVLYTVHVGGVQPVVMNVRVELYANVEKIMLWVDKENCNERIKKKHRVTPTVTKNYYLTDVFKKILFLFALFIFR